MEFMRRIVLRLFQLFHSTMEIAPEICSASAALADILPGIQLDSWEESMQRRNFLGAVAVPLLVARASISQAVGVQSIPSVVQRKGRLNQGVTQGVFARGMSLEDSCKEAARLGIKGFDLIGPAGWPTLKKYGLVPSMYQPTAGASIPDALNRKENHERIDKAMRAAIDESVAAGVPNIITFSGNRRGMADAEGADNCVAFLNNLKGYAETKGVTICMELLNSKVNHKDYMFDHIAWGVDVMKRVNSPRVKILYDIYHAQIMDGDVARNIKDNFQWIGHFHTGGNPGRHDIDESQELNYRFIAQTIADLGFTGFLSHEYSPTMGHDPIEVLDKAIGICDV
jgi:hydroxypyruvate isomerase